MAFTTDDLVASIARGVTLPSYDPLLNTADILALANEEMQTRIVPMIRALRQEFFVTTASQVLISGQDAYTLPARAVGRTLRDLKLVCPGVTKRKLVYIEPEEEHFYGNTGSGGEPVGFFFRGDSFVLRPTPLVTSSTYSLEVWYELRPSSLIPVSAAGKVVSVDFVNNLVVLTQAPAVVLPGSTVDFISSSGGHSLVGMDLSINAISGNQLAFTLVPPTLAVGDYCAPSQQSPVVMLPDDVFPVLAQAVQCRILEAIGDMENLQAAKMTLTEKIVETQKLLAPRVEGEVRKVTNRQGLLRRGTAARFSRRFF